ncbi:histidine--tRNA ligase [Kaistia dalseonensis]|uniref:Histidine--tRNA ligase n=1 Tax=Kaistia dalseonensis TaxID=410840 RepID=A0ABU0H6V6_9HYPH|nr:histidine--tRNA ligase [Kaistia dalseonensis]MCX5495445.1 histidine--tRNA ligase [Kaistia dalseonensis]MDQ0438034.1 histidyl-tRNA synthetase [Kaistia dalseonensis]
MAEKEKSNALKARLPRGLVDRHAGAIKAADRMIATIRGIYELYGFEPVETPLIEYTDALGKFLPDQDRPNEGVFSFQDDDEQWLSLRYDLTAPLARFVAENFDQLPKPYRSYRNGWVFRNEKPGPGRFRQFMQFDADTVGAASPAADAEMCMMMADTLEALGIQRGDYVIRVNNRKVLDGVMESIGLTGPENAGRRLSVLRAIDKLDKFGPEGVELLLGAGRKDESGDFTKGSGLDETAIKQVMSYVAAQDSVGNEAAVQRIRASAALGTSGVAGVEELDQIATIVGAAGYGERIKIDPSVVRGLEYYTGPVFEAELLFETVNEDGQPARFGSVGGGGRYDGLVGRFRSEPVPATGFSIGVSRLMAALSALGKISVEAEAGPVVVTVFDRDRMGEYQKMVKDLRDAGIRAELYLGGSGPKAQLKYADKRNSPCVIIQGSDEKAKGVVQVKDLALGKQMSAIIADNAAWREGRPAQVEVPEADLVATVRAIVERRAGE